MIASLSEIETKSVEIRRMLAQTRDVRDYHSTPVEAAQVAALAGVDTLVFTHIIPPLGTGAARFLVMESLFLRGVKERFSGRVVIAEDGARFELPPVRRGPTQ